MKKEDYFKVSANPEKANIDWENFSKAYAQNKSGNFKINDDKVARAFYKIFGNSSFLARFLIKNPEVADDVFISNYLNQNKKTENFDAEIKKINFINLEDWLKKIRFYKYKELLRITLKDLNEIEQPLVYEELSHLALSLLRNVDERLLNFNIEKYGPPQTLDKKMCPHHFLSLGKLGGMELNYSSDIDLIAMIATDKGLSTQISLKEFFTKHVQLLTQVMEEKTEHGFLYRVDWDLRPQSKAGALINTFMALEDYYESFGLGWERQMMIKANLGSGTPELGKLFIKRIEPFVYRQSLDIENIREIQVMKEKIHEEMLKQKQVGFNVKLGVGGIREIEFFVQAFLLIFGGKNPEIRSTNTLKSLDNLKKLKVISQKQYNDLTQGYIFLRKLEHRLQLVDEAQTQYLSDEEPIQLETSRRMGYLFESNEQAVLEFKKDLAIVTENVHHAFLNLFSKEHISFKPVRAIKNLEKESLAGLKTELKNLLKNEDDFEYKLDTIRFFKKEKIKEILHLEEKPFLNREKIITQLSLLAEAIFKECFNLAINQLEPRFGTPLFQKTNSTESKAHLLCLACGKFGGSEIGYTSDLDMIFIYSENGKTSGPEVIANSHYFAKLVQKIENIISTPTRLGMAYEIDSELRPSGNAGALVTSLSSFINYQREVSEIWERQMLLKARAITGSYEMIHLIQTHLSALLYSTNYSNSILKEMNHLRLRVENEVAKENKDYIDYKLGKGALMDIEFILQSIQLRFASQYPVLQTTSTFDGLDQLFKIPIIDEDKAGLLKEAYIFYRTLGAKIVLEKNRAIHRISAKDSIWDAIAPKLGLDNGKQLWNQYLAYREPVREVYKKIMKEK